MTDKHVYPWDVNVKEVIANQMYEHSNIIENADSLAVEELSKCIQLNPAFSVYNQVQEIFTKATINAALILANDAEYMPSETGAITSIGEFLNSLRDAKQGPNQDIHSYAYSPDDLALDVLQNMDNMLSRVIVQQGYVPSDLMKPEIIRDSIFLESILRIMHDTTLSNEAYIVGLAELRPSDFHWVYNNNPNEGLQINHVGIFDPVNEMFYELALEKRFVAQAYFVQDCLYQSEGQIKDKSTLIASLAAPDDNIQRDTPFSLDSLQCKDKDGQNINLQTYTIEADIIPTSEDDIGIVQNTEYTAVLAMDHMILELAVKKAMGELEPNTTTLLEHLNQVSDFIANGCFQAGLTEIASIINDTDLRQVALDQAESIIRRDFKLNQCDIEHKEGRDTIWTVCQLCLANMVNIAKESVEITELDYPKYLGVINRDGKPIDQGFILTELFSDYDSVVEQCFNAVENNQIPEAYNIRKTIQAMNDPSRELVELLGYNEPECDIPR